jgi:hypothetical protein
MNSFIGSKAGFSAIITAKGIRYYSLANTYAIDGDTISFQDLFRGSVSVHIPDITEVLIANNVRASDNNAQIAGYAAKVSSYAAEIPGSIDLLRNAVNADSCFATLQFCQFYQLPLQYPVDVSGIDVNAFRERHVEAVATNYKKYLAYVTNGNDVQKDVLIKVIDETFAAFLKRVNGLKTVRKIYAEWPNMFLPTPAFYANVVL